jgi:hypothetical protein
MSFVIFDETFYLASYSDVALAVSAGVFQSGFDHFQQSGLNEGRVKVSPLYNEQIYLRNNPDVEAAVDAGILKSGLEHYIQYGEAEGRSPGAFDEEAYLERNPDVALAVDFGVFESGVEHYIDYGQFDRRGYFVGTDGNDTILGIGALTGITGIDIEDGEFNPSGSVTIQSLNRGTGEVDTLIGGAGKDIFYLGSSKITFYLGGGSTDYALIKNFDTAQDRLYLQGNSPADYNIGTVNGNVNISTLSGDLVAILEGVTSLSQYQQSSIVPGTFFLR